MASDRNGVDLRCVGRARRARLPVVRSSLQHDGPSRKREHRATSARRRRKGRRVVSAWPRPLGSSRSRRKRVGMGLGFLQLRFVSRYTQYDVCRLCRHDAQHVPRHPRSEGPSRRFLFGRCVFGSLSRARTEQPYRLQFRQRLALCSIAVTRRMTRMGPSCLSHPTYPPDQGARASPSLG